MFKRFQQMMVALAIKADARATAKDIKKLGILGRTLSKGPSDKISRLAEIGRIADQHHVETSSWITIDQFREGTTGPFDACDLRHWLDLAELAGVPHVPAKEILRLSEDAMSVASGKVDLPDTPTMNAARKNLTSAATEIIKAHMSDGMSQEMEDASKALTLLTPNDLANPVSREEIEERLFDAMDGVPEGWMVRSARVGPSNLKALAGSGHAGKETPEVKFGANLEVGPGWVRIGNRRRIDTTDLRTIKAAAEGPVGGTSFLARPWVKAARYFVHDDPHREETPLRGPGIWPAEWRAFIEDGEVVGVSSYYSWIGEATPENAQIALEVRELAQRIADKATELSMWPRYMDIEFIRASANPQVTENQAVQEHLELFGREKVAFCIDFIETDDGLMLLEGGPPNTPFGGGHPCGFAGCGGEPFNGNKTHTEGVAFRNMPHVLPGDPRTWKDGDRSECILSWGEVERLAKALHQTPSHMIP
jgi:hypothetical protein